MSTLALSPISLLGLNPATYVPHAVHRSGRAYPETNCYSDILIELLHARGDEPLAALGCTLRTDFEGDQFTFFKPAPGDLERLFGLDVHEMQPHRSLPVQAAEQLAAGRTLLVELDSYHLPDTSATDYRRRHVKTTVAIEAIDVDGRFLRYFHNAGLYDLGGDDFDGAFRLGRPFDADVLPPYTELARFDAGPRPSDPELRAVARELSRAHLRRRPATNPFTRFGTQLAGELPALLEGSEQDFHDYAFATVRMAGSAFEVAASHVEWLLRTEGWSLWRGNKPAEAAEAFGRIVDGCKILSFRLARRRPFDASERVAGLAEDWAEGMAALDRVLG